MNHKTASPGIQTESAERDAAIYRDSAGDLAEHLFELGIFNRTDARGGYCSGGTFTRKQNQATWTPNDVQTLRRHFEARNLRDIIGVHSTNPATGTCKWGAIDIDAHGDGADPDVAATNLRRAIAMQEIATDMGLRLHLFSSNGIERCGIHGWMFLDQPVASERVFALLQTIVGGQQIETFPRQPNIPATGYGNWIRLFGRHYKRPEWAKYWGGRGWLTAEQTVEAILKIEPDDAERVPEYRAPIIVTIQPEYRGGANFAQNPDSLAAWLTSKGVAVAKIMPLYGDGSKLILSRCPFAGDHGADFQDTSVVVTWRPTGIGFKCHHNRCTGKGWRELRRLIDPEHFTNAGPSQPIEVVA